jgi:hypothetical protein
MFCSGTFTPIATLPILAEIGTNFGAGVLAFKSG